MRSGPIANNNAHSLANLHGESLTYMPCAD